MYTILNKESQALVKGCNATNLSNVISKPTLLIRDLDDFERESSENCVDEEYATFVVKFFFLKREPSEHCLDEKSVSWVVYFFFSCRKTF